MLGRAGSNHIEDFLHLGLDTLVGREEGWRVIRLGLSSIEVPHLEADHSYLFIMGQRGHVEIRRPECHEVVEHRLFREVL